MSFDIDCRRRLCTLKSLYPYPIPSLGPSLILDNHKTQNSTILHTSEYTSTTPSLQPSSACQIAFSYQLSSILFPSNSNRSRTICRASFAYKMPPVWSTLLAWICRVFRAFSAAVVSFVRQDRPP